MKWLTELHDYVLKIPIDHGTILIDFFSGNIVLLKDRQIKDEKIICRLNELGFFKNSEAKLALLKNKWERSFLANTAFSYVLDYPHNFMPDIINEITHEVTSREISKLNLELVLYDKLPSTLFDHLQVLGKNKLHFALRFHEEEYFACRRSFEDINTFIGLLLNQGASVNLYITIRKPKDFLKCMINMRKVANEFNIPIIVEVQLEQGDCAERILPFADVYFNNQLHALIHYIKVVPGGMNLTDNLFNCTYNLDLPFYQKYFETIFDQNLNRFMRVRGGGVLRSIQSFMDTNMFFPPMLLRCSSGNLVHFKEASVICCSKQKPTCTLYMQNDGETSYLGRELSTYRDSHLLYCRSDKVNFATYGGVCPLQSLETQVQNAEALITSFFNYYFTHKEGEHY